MNPLDQNVMVLFQCITISVIMCAPPPLMCGCFHKKKNPQCLFIFVLFSLCFQTLKTLKKLRRLCVRACVCACVRASQVIPRILPGIEVIIKLGMDIRMHHAFIILTLTLIQGHTDLIHENNRCLIISETFQSNAHQV